jgi:hypothetical protein
MKLRKSFLVILLLAGSCPFLSAQLKQPGAEEPGKNYWFGLTGRDSLALSRVWKASLVVPGYSQAYNRDYWKLPVVWGGIGGSVFSIVYHNYQYQKTGDPKYQHIRNWSYAGLFAVYWGSLMDGIVSYNTGKDFVPSRATLYSAMLPGLGQIYNGDYWKLPVVYGGLALTLYMVDFYNTQYQRYGDAFAAVSAGEPDEFNGRLSTSKLTYYRDNSRRSRDYAILFTVLVYVLNVIDANVFATLKDFDVSDDLSFRLQPAILNTNSYALQSATGNVAVGLQMQLTF